MTKRVSVPEKMKTRLLRETNYRCAYCLKNITPVAYWIEERILKKAKEYVPHYIQPYEATHIVPWDKNKTKEENNSFENLLALCTDCHNRTEQEKSRNKNPCISMAKLKELKLYWLIASGRFTRLEIDLLMALNCNDLRSNNRFLNGLDISDLVRIDIKNNQFDQVMNNVGDYLKEAKTFLTLKIPRNLAFLVTNLVKSNMVYSFMKSRPIELINLPHQKYQPHWFLDGNSNYIIFIRPSCSKTANGEIEDVFLYDDENIYYWISEYGKNFCEQFHEAYKDLDSVI